MILVKIFNWFRKARLNWLFILGSMQGMAQTSTPPYVPNVIPPSPNAASLMKFTDIPVSLYTGTADVSVPIYTIHAKGMDVPVNLAYHTGGVRIKEESGWVGLGWALNAGGTISRTVKGKDDFASGNYFGTMADFSGDPTYAPVYINTSTLQAIPYFGPYGYLFFCNDSIYFNGTARNISGPLAATNSFDFESDSYSYNFPGYSGKFIITRTGQVVQQVQDNLKFQFEANGNSFTVRDENGNVYYFSDKEYTNDNSSSVNSISSWMLSRIVTQVGDTVKFNYQSDSTWTYTMGDKFEVYRYGCNNSQPILANSGTYVPAKYLNITLKNIQFNNGQLDFSFDGVRPDLQNGKKLNSVVVWSKDASGVLRYVKESRLYYSYFNSDHTSGTDQELERLKLDSVAELSGSLRLPPYYFKYRELGHTDVRQVYTAKHGFAVDHWGYFNGKTNNTQFTPSYTGYLFLNGFSTQDLYVTLSGADRSPDSAWMKIFSLSSVRYPTGGKSEFVYDANEYDEVESSKTGIPDIHELNLVDTLTSFYSYNKGLVIDTVDLSNYYGATLTWSVTFRNPFPFMPTNGKIYVQFNGYYYQPTSSNFDCSSNSVCTLSMSPLTIPANGKYALKIFIDSSINTSVYGGTYVTFNWKELASAHDSDPGNLHPPVTASGLRIRNITDYSAEGSVAKKRFFNYNLFPGSSNSNGRIMTHPTYLYYENILSGSSSCAVVTRGAGSNTGLSSDIRGNVVGYVQVEEYEQDPTTNSDLGKTVYRYFNSTDTLLNFGGYRMPGIANIGNNLDGQLLSKTRYARSSSGYVPVSMTENFYRTTNRKCYWDLKLSAPFGAGGEGCPSGSGPGVDEQYLGQFSPAVKSERILLDSTCETIYDQSDPTRPMQKSVRRFYDNPVHYLETRSLSVDSKGMATVIKTMYPQDYIPGGNSVTNNTVLDSMIQRNMVATAVEKRDSLYFPGSAGGFVKSATAYQYKIVSASGNALLADKVFDLAAPYPINNFQPFAISGNTITKDARYRQMISFDGYESLGNPTQYTPVDQVPVSILWDYKHVYPVAKVIGSVYADAAFTSFEAEGNGNWTIASASRDTVNFLTGRCSYNLSSGNITKTGLTTGKTYLVTYWSKSGTHAPTGGTVTTRTGATALGWTYYEHSVVATATTFVISGTGNIDELRLYPAAALLTSLTYTPLVGTTTSNDPNSEISFYEYDGLQRLRNIKDYQGNIVKNFQYNYKQACTNCTVQMRTMAGTPTLSYPVGVFDVNGNLVGNAATQTQYVTLWNSAAANSALGTLSAGSDSVHFVIAVNAGQSAPGSVTGCRYYQYDISFTSIDGIKNNNGCYVDFGDGTRMHLGASAMDSSVARANSTVPGLIYSNTTLQQVVHWTHTYPDNSAKTVTIYHNDGTEEAGLYDNSASPPLVYLTNFRGYMPQNTTYFGVSCYQQSSALTFSNIVNWNQISSINEWHLGGASQTVTCKNLGYAQDFMKNNKNLTRLSTIQGTNNQFITDPTFKISKLKSDWNYYFTGLTSLTISDDEWNREDLTYLWKLNWFYLAYGNANHANDGSYTSIPTSVIDNVINQINAGAGQFVTNGTIWIETIGVAFPYRSSASDAAVANLTAKGWHIYLYGSGH